MNRSTFLSLLVAPFVLPLLPKEEEIVYGGDYEPSFYRYNEYGGWDRGELWGTGFDMRFDPPEKLYDIKWPNGKTEIIPESRLVSQIQIGRSCLDFIVS